MRFKKRAVWPLLWLAGFVLPAYGQVEVSLAASASSIQPGHPFTVALRMLHQPGWHTYWLNAGTGYPTTLQWDLPPGWSAGKFQWPTPHLIKDSQGNVTGQGYEGLIYLPVTIMPAANAGVQRSVTLGATAKWLMCADFCVPGQAHVALTLPISPEIPHPNAGMLAEIASMSMPQPAQGWTLRATQDVRGVTLGVTATGEIRDPHFYSESGFIRYDQPQIVTRTADQTMLTLAVTRDHKEIAGELIGVLAYTDASGAYGSVKVNVPLSSPQAAMAVAGSSGAASSSAVRPAVLSGAVLLLALLGGLILNLMPCVFPVLGIKIMGFVNEAGSERRRVILHALVFTLGVLLSFWVLAGVLAALRAGGSQLGWGFQLQSAPFVFALAVVMLVFALSLSGVFEFGLQATGVGAHLQMRQGYGGSFFAGVLATMVATPCSAPFLAPALGAALALPVAQSFVVFTAVALGLSAPYLLLAAFPQAIKALPRPGRWMETFKQVMAFPLYATVAYLVWVLAGQTSENGLLSALLGLTVIALAVWLYGHYNAPAASPGRVRFAFAGGILLLILGLNLGWPRAPQASDLDWEPWSAERVTQLRAANRLIYVDFTARWCATCQANKKLVFGSSEVRKILRERDVALLKGDWTNADPRITAELAKWNRSAVPFNLLYFPDASRPKELPSILTPSIVLKAFRAFEMDAIGR